MVGANSPDFFFKSLTTDGNILPLLGYLFDVISSSRYTDSFFFFVFPLAGHFERRVAFGCDADLACVKAEFRDEWLRVSVSRRLIPIITQQSSRYAPIGRAS